MTECVLNYQVTGLRWCDIDMEEGIIDVNHTLVYYDHRTDDSKKGCYFNVNTTKTPAGNRIGYQFCAFGVFFR